MLALQKGRYLVRLAQSPADILAAQRLRHLCFAPRGAADGLDTDRFDALCSHLLVEECQSGRLACCFRVLPLASGAEIHRSYSAQSYDLERLTPFAGPMLELGRFCVNPEVQDPDILRIAWGALTRMVDAGGVKLLFGCTSFRGTDPAACADAFVQLRNGHQAPPHWNPGRKAQERVDFATLPQITPDPRAAQRQLPPLLRTYLLMGGWVSDHAVIDRAMNTMHVFTGLEITAIPPARARLLRAVAE